MPFSITCPSCSAKLKTATAIPVGRSVKCPKCANSFAVSNDNMQEVDESRQAMPATKPAPAAARTTTAPPRKPAAPPPPASDNPFSFDDSAPAPAPAAKKKPIPVDDDDKDEAPRARKRPVDDEEEEVRPAKKRRRDEDDEEAPPPRARKRRDEDDEADDDRPKAKRRPAADDEEDDAPRARKRRRDADDEEDDDYRPGRKRGRDEEDDLDDDDRPKKKGKKKKKKGNLGLKIGLAVGGVLGLVGIGFLLYYLLGGGGGYDSEMLALMPSDTQSLDYSTIDKFNDTPKFKKLIDKQFDSPKFAVLKGAGLTSNDVKSTLEGTTEKLDHVTVFRLKSAPDKGKFTSGASESKAGDKSYWKVKKGAGGSEVFVAFPADNLLLVTAKEDVIKGVLNKEAGKISIPESLQDISKKVSGGDIWQAHISKGGKEKGGALRVDLSSSSSNVTMVSLHDNAEGAASAVEEAKKKQEEAKKNIDEVIKFVGNKMNDAQKDAFKKMITNASISKDGNYAEISFTMDLSPFENLDDGFGFMPGLR